MSILSRLFGGSGPAAPEEPDETYKGFRIRATPEKSGSQFRIGARIEKDIDGEICVHHLIRADVLPDQETAVMVSISKATMLIDEVGDKLFER